MALLLASCLAGLLLCEAGLRLFHPKYKHLAEAAFIRDPNLLFVRLPNHRSIGRHPETHARHLIFHNNFGLRQHRNFSAADLESSVNIGFFGDSFTENYTMEAPFSFTEPLDYLLNIGGGGGQRTQFRRERLWNLAVPPALRDAGLPDSPRPCVLRLLQQRSSGKPLKRPVPPRRCGAIGERGSGAFGSLRLAVQAEPLLSGAGRGRPAVHASCGD